MSTIQDFPYRCPDENVNFLMVKDFNVASERLIGVMDETIENFGKAKLTRGEQHKIQKGLEENPGLASTLENIPNYSKNKDFYNGIQKIIESIYSQEIIEILPKETRKSLFEKISQLSTTLQNQISSIEEDLARPSNWLLRPLKIKSLSMNDPLVQQKIYLKEMLKKIEHLPEYAKNLADQDLIMDEIAYAKEVNEDSSSSSSSSASSLTSIAYKIVGDEDYEIQTLLRNLSAKTSEFSNLINQIAHDGRSKLGDLDDYKNDINDVENEITRSLSNRNNALEKFLKHDAEKVLREYEYSIGSGSGVEDLPKAKERSITSEAPKPKESLGFSQSKEAKEVVDLAEAKGRLRKVSQKSAHERDKSESQETSELSKAFARRLHRSQTDQTQNVDLSEKEAAPVLAPPPADLKRSLPPARSPSSSLVGAKPKKGASASPAKPGSAPRTPPLAHKKKSLPSENLSMAMPVSKKPPVSPKKSVSSSPLAAKKKVWSKPKNSPSKRSSFLDEVVAGKKLKPLDHEAIKNQKSQKTNQHEGVEENLKDSLARVIKSKRKFIEGSDSDNERDDGNQDW